MQTDLILLIIATTVKAAVLLGLSNYLLQLWKAQQKRYKTDFPFLMGISFLVYGTSKVLDIFLYIYGSQNSDVETFQGKYWPILNRIRFLLSPGIVIGILALLLSVIWLEDKKKIQIGIGFSWIFSLSMALVFVKNLENFYNLIAIVTAPIMIFSILTFLITHKQKKLPEIDSLLIAIGYSSLTIAQLMRSMWVKLGSGGFGLSWIAELLELSCLIIVALGFIKNASYKQKRLQNKPFISRREKLQKTRRELEKKNEYEKEIFPSTK